MSFLIAAAGTGGHVFPGLAVGEALIDLGVGRDQIVFVGGNRLEAEVYPAHDFEFVELELRGLKRSLAPSNLGLPRVVLRAKARVLAEIEKRQVKAVLGMGGYVTIPVALAAHRRGVDLFISEQNAGAGLANRIASRWAERVFVSFPDTDGLESGDWVGNPVRHEFAVFDRSSLRPEALRHFGLDPDIPVLGVFGGSLGADAINRAIADLVSSWSGPPMQVLHLVGTLHEHTFDGIGVPGELRWVRIGFEDRMDLFFAAVDLVVSRAGGAVAEITATGTPSILIPGDFGSSGHQGANARFLEGHGAAMVLPQDDIGALPSAVISCFGERARLAEMEEASLRLARPDAAKTIARAMIESTR